MGRAIPLTAAKRAEVEALIRAGDLSRNAIAKAAGISPPSVTKIAQDAGLTFSREAPMAATRAAQADNARRRAELVEMLYTKALDFLKQTDSKHLAFSFGGKDNTYNEHELNKPPTGDIKNLMVSAGIAIQRAADLERFDAPDSADGVKSMLAGLGRALGVTPSD